MADLRKGDLKRPAGRLARHFAKQMLHAAAIGTASVLLAETGNLLQWPVTQKFARLAHEKIFFASSGLEVVFDVGLDVWAHKNAHKAVHWGERKLGDLSAQITGQKTGIVHRNRVRALPAIQTEMKSRLPQVA